MSLDQRPEAGAKAPDFTLLDQDGQSVSLSDFKGKNVLVYFYPKAMTPGCTVQACGLRDAHQAYADNSVVVLGISPDAPARLQKFAQKENLNFTLLSDEDHAVADAYGVWGPKKFMGRVFDGIHRVSFIVDKEGVIQHVFPKVKTATHHDDVLNWIQQNL